MNPKLKISLYVLAAITLLVIIWYFFIRKKTNKTSTDETIWNTPKTQTRKTLSLPPVAGWPLKYGSYGREVAFFQAYANKEHSYKLEVDGKWGAKTQTAYVAIKAKAGTGFSFADGINKQAYQLYIKEAELKTYLATQGIDIV